MCYVYLMGCLVDSLPKQFFTLQLLMNSPPSSAAPTFMTMAYLLSLEAHLH